MSFDPVIRFIVFPDFSGWLFVIRLVFVLLTLLFLIGIIYFFNKATWWQRRAGEDLQEFVTFKPVGAKGAESKWRKISGRLESGRESEYKLAIIEADTVLNEFIGKMGYGGDTLGEKLKKVSPAVLPDVHRIQEAHKVRNNIVHDPDYRLVLDEAKKTMLIYEKALRDLEVF